MILGISKKVIFLPSLFINFLQPSNSSELHKTCKFDSNLNPKLSWLKISNKNLISSSKLFSHFEVSNGNQKFLKNNAQLLAGLSEKREELVIQSDKQSEINNVIYAEGNVSILYKGKLLQADIVIYDKTNKTISAKGNIALILRDQIFKLSELEYSFISEKGFLLDVKGFINTDNLMEDLFSNFSLTDSNKIENLLKLEKKEVLNTPGEVDNWFFLADKITIDGQKWKSK